MSTGSGHVTSRRCDGRELFYLILERNYAALFNVAVSLRQR